MAPQQYRLEDIDEPAPPPPEFDRDVECALALRDLAADERNTILLEARNLARRGWAREAVANWICRKVARIVGGRSGFDAYDADFKVIDPPEIKAAIAQRNSRAGSKRQDKRNAAFAEWHARIESLVAAGGERKDILKRAYTAVMATTRRALGDKLRVVKPEFEGLPPIFGPKADRVPGARSLRKRLAASLVHPKIVE